MQQKQDDGLLIHKWSYKNTSFITAFLTRHHGQVRMVSKGADRARKNGSKIKPIAYFNFYQLVWQGNSQLQSLYKYEQIAPIVKLHPSMMFVFMTFNEIMLKLLPIGLECENLFICYKLQLTNACQKFSSANEPAQKDLLVIINNLYEQLLETLGFGICWHRAGIVQNEDVKADKYYKISPACTFIGTNSNHPNAIKGEYLLAIRDSSSNSADEKKHIALKHKILQYALKQHLSKQKMRATKSMQQLYSLLDTD